MNVIMASVEQDTASLEQREAFAFSAAGVRQALVFLRPETGVAGAVLLSTCNRTELYLSTSTPMDPAGLLCKMAGLDSAPQCLVKTRRGEEAARHLMEVTCGLHSRILCEDQIITQVRTAALIAREERAIDPVLETLFRTAVTAAKEAKTAFRVRATPLSAASEAIAWLKRHMETIGGKRILVIGNGEMGRLCAQNLREAGCAVTVTLRTYRHGETIVPPGCAAIPYDERFSALESADAVISATASPHYTLTKEMLGGLTHCPKWVIDLAVPRDIDPEIASLPGVLCCNIDQLGSGTEVPPELEQINALIEEKLLEFLEWKNVRACRRDIAEIKALAVERVEESLADRTESENDRELVELAVEKAVELLLFSDKLGLNPEGVGRVKQGIINKLAKGGGRFAEKPGMQ